MNIFFSVYLILPVSFGDKIEYNGYRKREVDKLKFINIKDTKLKIILTPDECRERGIDTARSEYTKAEIRSIVRELLPIAEGECGFSITTDKILIQAYPMPEGECEIFITKLRGISARDRSFLNGEEDLTSLAFREGVYRFDSRDILVRAIDSVTNKSKRCDIYVDEYGRYYIKTEEELTDGISDIESLIEFGERLRELPIEVRSEYGKKMYSSILLDEALADLLKEKY